MRLMDEIRAADDAVLAGLPDGRVARLPGAGELKPGLADCPLRYVLDASVMEMAVPLALDGEGLLARSLDLVRIPAETMWVEWRERDRRAALAELGVNVDQECEADAIAGVLAHTDLGGRSGVMRSAWRDASGVCVSPFMVRFDFGAPLPPQACDRISLALRTSDSDSLDAVLRRCAFDLHPDWEAYWARQAPGQQRRVALAALGPTYADPAIVAALCLLLAARGAVQSRPHDFSVLNRKRARRGRAALFDHLELRAALFPHVVSGEASADAHGRAAPRLHHVRGHLVRRGERLIWRRAHLRGVGAPVQSRTIALRLAG